MTTEQIMMRLREIEADLDMVKRPYKMAIGDREHYENAKVTLCELIEQMLADERQAREAHTMAELPFDGQGYPTTPQSQWTEEEHKRVAALQSAAALTEKEQP